MRETAYLSTSRDGESLRLANARDGESLQFANASGESPKLANASDGESPKLANASGGIKPRVERSGTRGWVDQKTKLANATDGRWGETRRSHSRALFLSALTPGSASLHPGLYAVARIRELKN